MRTIELTAEYLNYKTPSEDTRVRVELSGDISKEVAVALIDETTAAINRAMSRLLGVPIVPDHSPVDFDELHEEVAAAIKGGDGRP